MGPGLNLEWKTDYSRQEETPTKIHTKMGEGNGVGGEEEECLAI